MALAVTADTKTGVFNTTPVTSLTHSLAGVPAGSLLIVTTQNETDSSANANASVSGGGLTWTKKADASAASSGNAEIYEAVFAAGGSISVVVDWGLFSGANGTSRSSVCYVVTGQEASTSGATPAAGTAQTAPSVSITTTRANSIIFCVSSDWNAISGARTYRAPSGISPTVALEWVTEAGTHTCGYHYWYQATSAQSYVVGMSAPSTMGAGTAVYEVRAPSGAAGVSPRVFMAKYAVTRASFF